MAAIDPAGEGQHAVVIGLPVDLLRRFVDDERARDDLQVLIRHNDATGTIDVDVRPGSRGTWVPSSLIAGVTVEVRNEGGVRDQWQHSE